MNTTKSNYQESVEGHHYQIQFLGDIKHQRGDWFSQLGFEIYHEKSDTSVITLEGTVLDQSHLRGLLNKLWDLNLEITLVKRSGQE